MSNPIETSFIPQQPLIKVDRSREQHEAINLPLLLSLVIFFVTLSVAGGMFFYKKSIVKRVEARATELQNMESAIDIDTIGKYKRLDARITLARKLLKSHAIFSSALYLLERTTSDKVWLVGLVYESEDTSGKPPTLKLSGVATSYADLYFQIESWRSEGDIVASVILDKVDLDVDKGIVSFDISMAIKPDQMMYPALLDLEKNMKKNVTSSVGTQSLSLPANSSRP